MFLKFILLLLLVLMLSQNLLYINSLFCAIVYCSYGSCFQEKKLCVLHSVLYTLDEMYIALS